jgi:hypothetical protein
MCRLYLIFMLIGAPVLYVLTQYVSPISIFIAVSFFALFAWKVFQTPGNLALTTSAISFGLSYSVFLLAALLSYPLMLLIKKLTYQDIPEVYTYLCVAILQFLLAFLPFRFKRLKKGMPFLMERGSSDIGVFVSLSILLAIVIIGISTEADPIFAIPVIFAMVCGLILFIWWRSSLTKRYLQTAKARELENLKSELIHHEQVIDGLKSQNEKLSTIIHKDNKLIPAMEFAVSQFLSSVELASDQELITVKARELLAQLQKVSRERTGILERYEQNSKQLPSTQVLAVDTVLDYLYRKAKGEAILFDLSISGSVKYLVENIIPEDALNTLLADLIENAIIATKKSKQKNIMVHLGISEQCYCVEIYDSGESFDRATMQSLGLKRATTHARDGGSGIGFMTAFELFEQYKASFLIEEFCDDALFTKKVSVCFDHMEQYRIKTRDMNVTSTLSARCISSVAGALE